MINKTEFIAEIERIAPLSYAESWDNSGRQIDLGAREIGKIAVALEITDAVISEAAARGADMIVVHHPLFFTPQKRIDTAEREGRYAAALIQNGISVYAAHTSYDAAPGGMNDVLAARVGLNDISSFSDAETAGAAYLRRGVFGERPAFADICSLIETLLGMKGRLKTVGDPKTRVLTGAVCGGAGGEFVKDVRGAGIDFYLTSDVRHNEAQSARESGLCLIDGGHYGTENIFASDMAERLRVFAGTRAEIYETAQNLDPWR